MRFQNMTDMSERIKQRMGEKGLKSVDVVKMTGASKGTVSLWTNGGSQPLGRYLVRLSLALGVRALWLQTGEGEKEARKNNLGVEEIKQDYNIDRDPNFFGVEVSAEKSVDHLFTKIPKYNVELSAGHGSNIGEEDGNGFLYFRKDWIEKKQLDDQKLCVVYVKGQSMEPTVCDGEVILVDSSEHYTHRENVSEGFIYAINIDGEAMVKRLFRKPGGGIIARSDSSATQYQDIVLEGADLDYLRVIGRAIWHAGDL